MGIQRITAFLQSRPRDLGANDYALMTVICAKWNDHQVRDLDIRFPVLLEDMPYTEKSRPDRMLRISLSRLVERGLLYIEHNGSRYLRDRWLHITIAYEEFWQTLEDIKGRSKSRRQEEPAQSRLLESRAMNARPESTRDERSHLIDERSQGESTRDERSNARDERASHSRVKIPKDLKPKKIQQKAPVAHGIDTAAFGEAKEIENPEPTPRPALVPVAAIAEPQTAAAVYNTLEIDTKEPDMMSQRETEIRTILYQGIENGRHLTDDRRYELRTEYSEIAHRKRLEAHHDNPDRDETLRQVPADQAHQGVLRQQARQRRPAEPLQTVSEPGQTPAHRPEGTAPPLHASERHLPALQEAEAAEPVPHPPPPQKWPMPAVHQVPQGDRR